MLRDQAARDRILNELDRNTLVLAGAGAGKTTALVGRMLRCVVSGRARVEHMAAITFTRKAAGEMRERFFEELHAAEPELEGEEAERVRAALAAIDQCYMGTIHSFCGRLLRERPLEAGLPPDFTELEAREASALGREAWDRFMQQRYLADDPRLEELDACGLTTEDLYRFFQVRCGLSDVGLKLEEVPCPDLRAVVNEALALTEEAAVLIPEPAPKGEDDFMTLCRLLPQVIAYHDLSKPEECAKVLRFVKSHLKIKVTYWGDARSEAKALRDGAVDDFEKEVLGPALRQWRQHIYPAAASFVEEAVEAFAEERRRKGTLTFFDLLATARSLLRNHSEVRRALQKRYRVLFVDEFQDTDPIQAEVLLYLTGEDTHERDWTKLVPRPGSLFVVGDAKQSIYRFRRADLDTFRLVGERIRETGGSVEHLNTSFRSLGNLCDWFNRTFSDCFAAHSEDYQAPFAPLYKFRAEGKDAVCVRVNEIPKIKRSPVAQIVEQDAVGIADFIAAALAGETEFNAGDEEGALLGEKAEPGDFMILTRRKANLSAYAQALEERGIPFDIAGGERLDESVELRALVEVLEAVAAPENPLPVLGVLRGPLMGLSDDDLYAFRKGGGAFDYRSAVPEKVPSGVKARVRGVYALLKQAERWLFKLTPPAAVERLLERLGLIPFSALEPMGSFRAGNLLRILALIRRWCDQGMHWLDVARELRALIDEDDYSLEEMTLESGRQDVVRLMNVHQSKGLQAPVVFLADPYDRSINRKEPRMHVSRTGERSYLSMPIERSNGPHHTEVLAEPAGWESDKAEEERFAEAEEMRLRYVAATRARNLLVVSRYAGNTTHSPWAPLYPWLEDVPLLEAPPASTEPRPAETAYDVEALRERIAARWERVHGATATETSVTGERPEAQVQRRRVEESTGMRFGRVVHELFEAAARGTLPDDERAYIERLLQENRAQETFQPSEVLEVLQRFRSSSLWQLVEAAPRVYTEVPMAVSSNGSVQRGILDLVLEGPEGWVVVDYKTDAFSTPGERAALVEKYRKQVQTYSTQWRRITGEEVARQGLWFTADGAFVEVSGN